MGGYRATLRVKDLMSNALEAVLDGVRVDDCKLVGMISYIDFLKHFAANR